MIIERTAAEMTDRKAQIAAEIITHLAEHGINAERDHDSVKVIHPEYRHNYYTLVEFSNKQTRSKESYWTMENTGQIVVKVKKRKSPSFYRETSSRFTEKKDGSFNLNMLRAILGSAQNEWDRIEKATCSDMAKSQGLELLNQSIPAGKMVNTSWRGPLSSASTQVDGKVVPAIHINQAIPLTEETLPLLVSIFDLYPDMFYQDEEQLDK